MKYHHLLLPIILVSTFSQIHGQIETDFTALSERYPDEKAIILNLEKHCNIEQEEDSLYMIEKTVKEKYFFTDKSQGFGDEYIFYSSFVDVLNVDAFMYLPKNGKHKKMRISNIIDKSDLDHSILYDDTRYKHVIFPRVDSGYKTLVEYTQVRKEIRFMGEHIFGAYAPIFHKELTLNFPNTVNIAFKIYNDDQQIIRFNKEEKGKKITYKWYADTIEKYEYSSNSLPANHLMPTLVFYVQDFQTKNGTQKVLSDTNDLYNYYKEWLKDLNTAACPGLVSLVDSLKSICNNNEELRRKIFYWTQENINYVAIEDGMSGMIPAEACDVYKYKYGDCKGMSSILKKMYDIAGISTYLTWVGTRDLPYSYREVPTPLTDNHMILTMPYNNDFVFLDATSSYLPFGMPSVGIQGKECLTAISDSSYKILDIPVMNKELNHLYDSIFLVLSEDDLKGHGRAYYTGYLQGGVSYNYNNLNDDDFEEYLDAILARGNNKFHVDEFEILNTSNPDKNVIIDYQFELPDYIRKVNEKYYLNLNTDKTWISDYYDLDEDKLDERISYKFTRSIITTFKIPDGYDIEHIPENTSFANDSFGFDIQYIRTKTKIIQRKNLFINTLVIRDESFATWNRMIDALNESYNKVIVIKK